MSALGRLRSVASAAVPRTGAVWQRSMSSSAQQLRDAASLWAGGLHVLNHQFADLYTPEHIEAVFQNSRELLSQNGADSVPFVCRLTWERLLAETKMQGDSSNPEMLERFPTLAFPRVYLVSPADGNRGQIGGALLEHISQVMGDKSALPKRLHIFSGACDTPAIAPVSAATREAVIQATGGRDMLRDEFPKTALPEMLAAADVVVAVAAEKALVDQLLAEALKGRSEISGASQVEPPQIHEWALSETDPVKVAEVLEPQVQQLLQTLAFK